MGWLKFVYMKKHDLGPTTLTAQESVTIDKKVLS